MITASNTDVLSKQLEEYSLDVQRRLKNMVAGFAREVSLAASNDTPVGSNDMFIEHSRYHNYYLDRKNKHGIPIEPGFHSGAWQYTETGNPTFTPVIFSKENAADDNFNEAESSYKLGDDFYIAATGPGYSALENGSSLQAPSGITAPTLAAIESAHQADFKKYYDAG